MQNETRGRGKQDKTSVKGKPGGALYFLNEERPAKYFLILML